MAVDRELGAGAWSYFGDPRAISHDGHTFTGWISTSGNVWVARYTRGGKLSQAPDLPGPRPRRSQQPVARVPPRRPPDGVLLAALGAPPAAARHPERDALHGRAASVTRSTEFGRVRTVPDQRPRRAGLHVSEPDPAPRQAVAVLARRRLEPDVLLHRGRPRMGAGPRARAQRRRGSGRTPSTSGTATGKSTPSSATATRTARPAACTTCATKRVTSSPWAGVG